MLGACGLIGAEICRRLAAEGHEVTGLGRSAAEAARVLPGLPFRTADLARLRRVADWAAILPGFGAVVNAAGALQDGPGDSLDAVHRVAIEALVAAGAKAGRPALVQISACGVAAGSPLPFFATKAAGDAAVAAYPGDWFILRPGLVIGRAAYGATTLLRMLAAVPLVQPIALPEARIQCVGLAEVAEAVALCLSGAVPRGTVADLVEPEARSLAATVAAHRRWLGFPPARATVVLRDWQLRWTAWQADLAGRLGWRSPLRSTAVAALRQGVTGNPAPWRSITGRDLPGLEAVLARMPALVQDRWHARLALLGPAMIAGLGLFWFLSGLFGLLAHRTATAILVDAGWPHGGAQAAVLSGIALDLGLAAGLLWRPTARIAATGMALAAVLYLVAGSVVLPALWTDPLGAYVKVIPAVLLALAVRTILDAR